MTVSGWTDLGPIPRIADETTPTARTVQQILPWAGRLWFSYGDYTANTGPSSLVSWDPTRGFAVVAADVATEGWGTLRLLDGNLFAPCIDPKVGPAPQFVRLRANDSVGHSFVVATHRDGAGGHPAIVHAYDAARAADGSLVLAGSALADGFSPAALWRSDDGGINWDAPVIDWTAHRYHTVFLLGGVLWTQAVVYPATPVPHAVRSDDGGRTWRDAGLSLFPEIAVPATPGGMGSFGKPVPPQPAHTIRYGHGARSWPLGTDRVAYLREWPPAETDLIVFDGRAATVASTRVRDVAPMPDGRLAVLAADGSVGAWDANRFAPLTGAHPGSAWSCAVWHGAVYAGTRDGHLWAFAPE